MPLDAILCAIFVGGSCAPSGPVVCDDRFPASCALSYSVAEEERVPYPRRKPRTEKSTTHLGNAEGPQLPKNALADSAQRTVEDNSIPQRRVFEGQLRAWGERLLAERLASRSK